MTISYRDKEHMTLILASLFIEAAVVGIVCAVFLLLMVIAGIRQILKDKD